MNSIFSPDSKLISILDTLADTMLLNLLFLLCCLPVVTIGAAFTALFAGCRAMSRKGACFRAFFHAFRSNFRRATLVWLVLLPVVLIIGWATWVIRVNDLAMGAFLAAALAGTLLLCLMSMCFLFYSRFECTFGQLLRNGALMLVSYPLRSLIIGIGCWWPVLCRFLLPTTFVQLAMIWVFLYSGTAAAVSVWLMKKPFSRLAARLGVDETSAVPEEAPAGS